MDILMPRLGETVTEGTIVRWARSLGDQVAEGELLLEIETDKAATEIPAPVAGRLARILVEAGATVPVGTVLAVLEVAGESQRMSATGPASPSPAVPAASPAEPAARDHDPPRQRTRDAATRRLSPAVRRLAREHRFDPASIAGTGRDGRVTRRDALVHISGQAARSVAAGSYLPFNRVRRRTAEHMVRSRSISPHVLQAIEVDFSGVERVRTLHGADWRARHGWSLTFLPFVAYAASRALREFPRLNSSVEGDGLRLHVGVHLAIAVDLGEAGLVAPVIRDAHTLSLAALAQRIHDVAQRARSNQLVPDDFAGGTYTLSNSGTFGTLITAPIINQPQVAILSIDGIRKRAVVVESGEGDEIAIRPVGVLAQSFDHRAVDGAYSAAFLQRLRQLLEQCTPTPAGD